MTPTLTETPPPPGPRLFPRVIGDWDELGFPLLADECPRPECGAFAVILNEWDAAECLTCSWREFGPDSPRADCGKWPDESRATDPEWMDQGPALAAVVLGLLGSSGL